jgi:hypothetical protein
MKYYYEIYKEQQIFSYYDDYGNLISYSDFVKNQYEHLEIDCKTQLVRKFSRMKDAKLFLNDCLDISKEYYKENHYLRKVELY